MSFPQPPDRRTALPDDRRASENGQSARAPAPTTLVGHSSGFGSEGLLEQIWRVLRHRKWIVLQGLIIVPVAVLLLTLSQPNTYTATATLLFRPSASPDDVTQDFDPDRAAATNEQLVELPTIGDQTAREVGGGVTGEGLRQNLTFEANGQSDLVQIAASSEQPERAALIANTYAETFIAFRRRTDRRQVQEAIEIVQRNLAALSPEERAGAGGRALTNRLDRLETAALLQTGNAELVQRAAAPVNPSGPRLRLNLALALLVGGALGFGLAALLEMVDRRIRRIEDLERIYRLPVLARIPRSRSLERSQEAQVLPRGAEAEAFRALRTNLRYYSVDREIRSILVASPLPGDGKSTVARQLAITMAAMGDSVCLVQADLHRGSFDGDVGGLSSVLAGWDLDSALVSLAIDEGENPRVLWTLPTGPLPPNPSELLESSRMRMTIAGLEERFDSVIIDSPALSVVSDALPLVGQVSGVVIVSRLGHTTRDAALELRKQLSLIEGRPFGVVANYAEPERGSDRGYYAPRVGAS